MRGVRHVSISAAAVQGAAVLVERAKQVADCLSGPATRTRAKHARRAVTWDEGAPLKAHLGELVVELIGSKAAGT